MFHVDKMLRVVNDWRPLYEGERKKQFFTSRTL